MKKSKLAVLAVLLLATPFPAGAASEQNTIRNNRQIMTWAYYTDNSSTRWYISYIGAGGKQDVYSLTSIKSDGRNGWGTVATGAATVDLVAQTVRVDPNLDKDSSDSYYDAGWKEWTQNPQIHRDRQIIQGSTVTIKWYFFYVPEINSWFIVNAPGYGSDTIVYKFATKNGEYDWIPVDGLAVSFAMQNGQKTARFNGGEQHLHWPMSGTVTSRTSDLEPSRISHKGTDIGSSDGRYVGSTSSDPKWNSDWTAKSIYSGADVFAAAPGTVVLVALNSVTGGRYVVIDHGCGFKTRYLHLHAIDAFEGQQVTIDTRVGIEGNTGAVDVDRPGATGLHLHFEFFHDTDNDNLPDDEWRSSPVSSVGVGVQLGTEIPSWVISCQ